MIGLFRFAMFAGVVALAWSFNDRLTGNSSPLAVASCVGLWACALLLQQVVVLDGLLQRWPASKRLLVVARAASFLLAALPIAGAVHAMYRGQQVAVGPRSDVPAPAPSTIAVAPSTQKTTASPTQVPPPTPAPPTPPVPSAPTQPKATPVLAPKREPTATPTGALTATPTGALTAPTATPTGAPTAATTGSADSTHNCTEQALEEILEARMQRCGRDLPSSRPKEVRIAVVVGTDSGHAQMPNAAIPECKPEIERTIPPSEFTSVCRRVCVVPGWKCPVSGSYRMSCVFTNTGWHCPSEFP